MTTIIGRVGIRVYPDTSQFPEELRRKLDRIQRGEKLEIPAELDGDRAQRDMRALLAKLKAKANDALKIDVKVDAKGLADVADSTEKVKENLREVSQQDFGFEQLKPLSRELRNILGIEESITDENNKALRPKRDLVNLLKIEQSIQKQNRDAAEKHAKAVADAADQARQLAFEMDHVNRLAKVKFELRGMNESQREIAELRRQLREIDNLVLDPTLSEEAIRKLLLKAEHLKNQIEDKLKGIDVDANIHADLGNAAFRKIQAQLAWLGRTRFVTFIPTVSAVAARRVATVFAALSGARLSGKILEDFNDLFKNIDKNLPKVALFGNLILGIGAAALSSASNLVTLGGGLAQIALAGLALPGILGGIAIGLTATIIPLLDIKKVIPDVVKEWGKLRKVMSDNFWKQAAKPFREVTKVLMPQLIKGFTQASTEVGKFWGAFAQGLSKHLDGALVPMFKDLSDSIAIATRHTGEMAEIITILGRQGAAQLPSLAEWFGRITARFANFLRESEKSGAFQDWIDLGIQRLHELGTVISATGSILKGLFKATEQSGGAGLGALGDALKRVADIVNSPEFQDGLVGVLTAADQAMQNIANIAGPAVETLFKRLSSTLKTVLPDVGAAIGTMVGAVADAFGNPRFQQGLADFFGGIRKAMETIRPIMSEVGGALGALLTTLGTAIKSFSPIVAELLSTLSQMFIALAPSIQTVVQSLSGAFLDVLKRLSPVLVGLAEQLAPVIEAVGHGLSEALRIAAPYIAEIVQSLGTALVDALKALAPYLPELAQKVFPQLLDAVKAIAPKIPELVSGFLGLVDAVVSTTLVEDLGNLVAALLEIVSSGVIPVLTANLPILAQSLADTASALAYLSAWQGMPAGLLEFTTVLTQLATLKPWNALEFARQSVESFRTAILDAFSGLPDWLSTTLFELIKGAMATLLLGLPGLMIDIGGKIIQGLGQGLSDSFPVIKTILETLTKLIPSWKPEATDHLLLYNAGVKIITGLGKGMTDTFKVISDALKTLTTLITSAFSSAGSWLTGKGRELVNGLKSGITSTASTVTTAAKGLLSNARSGLSGAGDALTSAGVSVVRGFISGIRSMFDSVSSVLSSLTDRLPDWKGPAQRDKTILVKPGQLIMEGLVAGLLDGFDDVRDTLSMITDEISSTAFEVGPVKFDDSSFAVTKKVSANLESTDSAQPSAAASQAPVVFQTTINNPINEPSSVSETRLLREMQQIGVIGQ